MDSSILFVIVIALVLCYLVPNWLRNRHDASHSHVDDRFSRAMRMLDQRDAKPVGSTRGMLLSAGVVDTGPLATVPREAAARDDSTDTAAGLIELSAVERRRGPSALARGVGFALATTTLALPFTAGLALLGRLSWALAAADAALAVGCLVLLRLRVRRRGTTTTTTSFAPAHPHATTAVAATTDSTAGTRSATVLYDEDAIVAVERAAALAAARAEAQRKAEHRAELEANLQPGEWLPTEVPKPAYLLKPNAPKRPVSTGQEIDLRDRTIDVREVVQPDTADDHTWLDEHAPPRRRVG